MICDQTMRMLSGPSQLLLLLQPLILLTTSLRGVTAADHIPTCTDTPIGAAIITAVLMMLIPILIVVAVLSCCTNPSVTVCTVTIRYRNHIGWNSSKIISRPNNLRLMRLLTPTWAIWCNGNTPKIRVE